MTERHSVKLISVKMYCTVSIPSHQYLKACQHFPVFLLVFFKFLFTLFYFPKNYWYHCMLTIFVSRAHGLIADTGCMYMYMYIMKPQLMKTCELFFNDQVLNPLTPVPALTCIGLCSTSDLITFDQNWHHLYSGSKGGIYCRFL